MPNHAFHRTHYGRHREPGLKLLVHHLSARLLSLP